MSQEHVWSCGKCGARVVANVGAILRTFKAHALSCPAIVRRQKRPVAKTARPASTHPHAVSEQMPSLTPFREGGQ